MKLIPNAVTAKFARQILVTKKNSPAILFSAGIVGVVASTVLACKATLAIDDILEESEKKMQEIDELQQSAANGNKLIHKDGRPANYTEADAKKDKTYVYIRTGASILKLYAPAIIVGVAGIACLVGAHRILNNRNAAITAAYSALDRSVKAYRKRVEGEVGEEKERELWRNVEEQTIHDHQKGKEIKTGQKSIITGMSPYARFFDEHNANWQPTREFNFSFIRTQQNWANHLLKARGHVLLNDVYEALGMERTKEGCVVGWVWTKNDSHEGDGYIDFGLNDPNNQARVLDFLTGAETGIWLDFNVDGLIYDKL